MSTLDDLRKLMRENGIGLGRIEITIEVPREQGATQKLWGIHPDQATPASDDFPSPEKCEGYAGPCPYSIDINRTFVFPAHGHVPSKTMADRVHSKHHIVPDSRVLCIYCARRYADALDALIRAGLEIDKDERTSHDVARIADMEGALEARADQFDSDFVRDHEAAAIAASRFGADPVVMSVKPTRSHGKTESRRALRDLDDMIEWTKSGLARHEDPSLIKSRSGSLLLKAMCEGLSLAEAATKAKEIAGALREVKGATSITPKTDPRKLRDEAKMRLASGKPKRR